MNKGLTQVAFGVLGAAMLSGSVFAAGPTVLPIPDVVITDRDKFGEFDSPTQATSANIYRFTSALSISDYVNYTPVDSSDTVSFLYTEHDFDENATGGAGAIRAGNRSLLIGGVEGETAAPNAGDIAGGPSVFQDILTTNIAYDIVNETRSGGDGTNPSGPNPGGPFLDEAVVQIYVAASAPSTQGAVATRTFNVYTTNDTDLLGLTFPGDQLLFTTATTIFTPVQRIDDFGGWIRIPSAELFYQGSFDFGFQPVNPANTWNTAQPPVVQPATQTVSGEVDTGATYQIAPSSTSSLTVGTLGSPGSSTASAARPYAPQFAYWRSNTRNLPTISSAPLQIEQGAPGDDNIYMVRWNVSATDLPFAQRFNTPDVRFQIGENSTFGVGVWKDEVLAGGVNSIRGANQQHRQYFIAETTGEVRMLFSTFDLFQGALLAASSTAPVNYNLTVDSIDVFRFSRNDLAAQSANSGPVYNQGGGSAVTLAPGQPAPPSGSSNFSTVDWQFNLDKFLFGGTDNFAGQNRWTTANQGSRLSLNLSSASYTQLAQASTLGFVNSQLPSSGFFTYYDEEEVISGVRNDQLVVLEAWMSSTSGSTPNNNLPSVKIGLLGDAFGGTSTLSDTDGPDNVPRTSGRASFREFEATNNSAGTDEGIPIANFANLETASKRYTAVLEPQVRVTRTGEGPGPDPTIDLRISITPFALSLQGQTPEYSGNITVDHIAVYVYDLPEDVADVQVP